MRSSIQRFTRAASVLLLVLVLSACAGYAGKIREPRRLFEAGQYELASAQLEKLVESKDNDQLLYLMDLGMVYHTARKYPEAIKTFHAAEKIADAKDFTSITQEVGAVITNDDVLFYKGEDFEKLLIIVYLALDYTLSGKWDDALVECRRVNRKLDMLVAAGAKVDEHNAFAKYLAAALFESQHDWNNAWVDYRMLRKWEANAPYLGVALLRLSDKLQAMQEFEQYRKDYPTEKDFRLGKDRGEVILLVEQGKAPVKVPSFAYRLVPMFEKRFYNSRNIVLRDAKDPARYAETMTLFDIEGTAIRELNAKIPGIIAKKIAGIAAKEAVGYGVGKAVDNKLVGALTSLFLHASDKADLRSWTTLPSSLQIARLTLPAGRRDLELDMVDASGNRIPNVARWAGVDIKPGGIVFLNYRTPD
jgi:hypothetical protein